MSQVRRRARVLIGFLAFWVLLSAAAAAKPGAAVASESHVAVRQAMKVLEAGGSAADAAITAALVGGVASATSSGIGGGGFALVWDADAKSVFVIDFREVAPAGFTREAFERESRGHAERALLTGVPGELAGLFEIHRRFGKKSWQEVVEPAARLAERGFAVEPHLANMLRASESTLSADPGIEQVFFPKGKPAALGQILKRPALAATLHRVAREGLGAFYTGEVARHLVQAARAAGSPMTEQDLARYRPVVRKPLTISWEGFEVFTMPPPSAGGMMLVQTLGLFSKSELVRLGFGSGAYQHYLAEAMRASIYDRVRFLADPDHQRVPILGLIAPGRLEARKKRLAIDRTHFVPTFPLTEQGTHHLVTADERGNVVSLTTTVNRLFGVKLLEPNTGVVLNDELDDFSRRSDTEHLGFQSPNRARPGARPVSSMTPTLVVKDGQVVLALGGSGGTAIATSVTQCVLASLAFGLAPKEIVNAPRFYVPTRGPSLRVETGAPNTLLDDFAWRGEVVETIARPSVSITLLDRHRGLLRAAADPRKHGLSLVR